MNLKQLEAFVYVTDTGSFSEAAKQLFLTQPTISSHISTLEKELNARLLLRNTRKVALTDKGKTLYYYARQMLDLQGSIEKEFHVFDKKPSDAIAIAASTIPAQYVLPECLAAFAKENPKATFDVHEGDSAEVFSMVSEGRADIGFAGTRAEKEAHCKDIPFYRDQLVIMTPATEHFRKMLGKGLEMSIFYDEPVILRKEGSGTRKEAEQRLLNRGIDLDKIHVVASISSSEAIMKSVSGGMGITVISEAAATAFVEEGRALAFPFPGKPEYRELEIVLSKDFKLGDTARQFVKFVQTYMKAKQGEEE